MVVNMGSLASTLRLERFPVVVERPAEAEVAPI
jgi:hypothetical protein